MYHVGSTFDDWSISEGGFITVGIGVREGRQTCFFVAVDPTEVSMTTLQYEPNEPRKGSTQNKMETHAQRSVYAYDLRLAQKGIGSLANQSPMRS